MVCLFIFSKNRLLVLLIFAIVSFVSFSFISAIIFMISFLLLTLGFFIASFSSCFRGRLGYLYDFSLVSWVKLVLLWTFPLALLLLNPIGFGFSCFHSFLCIFWFLFWFLLWFVGYSAVCCSASICLCFKCVFFFPFSCSWHLILPHCDQKRCLKWFQFFKIYQG